MSPHLFDLWCLHGFLGLPEDWRQNLFPPEFNLGLHTLDWLPRLAGLPDETPTLGRLADHLNETVVRTCPASRRRVLLGYSMGGRIALHMLLQAPKVWDDAIMVSTHPGLGDAGEREQRLKSDRVWARRFRDDPWDILIRDWNAQPVFRGDHVPVMPRTENAFSRAALALALERGSLARQPDLRPGLRDLNRPVLWVAGANDDRYRVLAVECQTLNPCFELAILPDAGHRVPWARRTLFIKTVMQFLNLSIPGTLERSR